MVAVFLCKAMRNAPSHALYLQGEMKALFCSILRKSACQNVHKNSKMSTNVFTVRQEGEQLTIRTPLPQFEEILLSCVWQLRRAARKALACGLHRLKIALVTVGCFRPQSWARHSLGRMMKELTMSLIQCRAYLLICPYVYFDASFQSTSPLKMARLDLRRRARFQGLDCASNGG